MSRYTQASAARANAAANRSLTRSFLEISEGGKTTHYTSVGKYTTGESSKELYGKALKAGSLEETRMYNHAADIAAARETRSAAAKHGAATRAAGKKKEPSVEGQYGQTGPRGGNYRILPSGRKRYDTSE